MGSLRAQAEADLSTTLEGAWGRSVTVIDPDGKTADLQAQTGDIGALIDPDTGIVVSGRRAHVAIRLASLLAAGFVGTPQAIARGDGMPWRFRFEDLADEPYEFAIRHSFPDRSLGVLTCIVEHWTP